MTELESKRRNDGAGAVAPALIVVVLPASSVSVVADALRDASFVVAHASTVEETRKAVADAACAILVLGYPLDGQVSEWLQGCRKQTNHPLPPVLLLCSSDQCEEAHSSQLGDLVIASDVSRQTLVQSVDVLVRLASSEQSARSLYSGPPPLVQAPESIGLATIQAMPFGFLVVDDHGHIIEGNQAAADLITTPLSQLIGADLGIVLGATGIEPSLLSASADASWVAGDFIRMRKDDILEIEYLACRAVLPGKHVLLLQDCTERNRRGKQQNRAEKMDSLSRLVGGMAHEFNNLLTVILGYSDMSAKLAAADSRFCDALLQIKNSAERGAQLTQLLLAFGRKQVMAPIWVDLNPLLVDLELQIRQMVGAGIQVQFQLAAALPPIFLDPMVLQRVLVQVVSNARDAMSENGILTVSTSEFEVSADFARTKPELRPGRYICLSIHDNGSGIASDVMPFIFEPFFTTRSVGQGTGMGLAFVDGVMHQNGGSVDVVSETGKGTTMRLFFSTVGNLPSASQASTPSPTLGHIDATILWVDDHEGVRKLGSLILRDQGYRVLEARDGAQALAIVQQNQPKIDLVVTDLMMPVMNGFELGRRIAALHSGLPVLYESGRLEDMRQAGGLDRNLHFLTKPFTRETLLAKVSQLMRRPGS